MKKSKKILILIAVFILTQGICTVCDYMYLKSHVQVYALTQEEK